MKILPHKGNGQFRGIGLVKVIFKGLSRVFNRRIGVAMNSHDVLPQFWVGQGTETASLEAK